MVQIKVTGGIIEGEKLEDNVGESYYSFKGIPYAEPPIGELRFQAPKPLKGWTGVLSAKAFGAICPQHDSLFQTQCTKASEDCLYLNVYSPEVSPTRPKAVMVWIHGGGFFCGSGNDNLYGPEYLMRHDVVLVTMNYRLGVFGFLCLDTEEIPGNAGMKDQVAALKWVKENISKFGGDPENVTVFGESAGSASVSYHLVSPMSKGLFKRAIMQSGVTTNCWAEVLNPRERALQLAAKLGCGSKDDNEIVSFLKSCPPELMLDHQLTLTYVEKRAYPDLPLAVVSEKKFNDIERFYYGDSYTNIRTNIHKGLEIMMGYTEHEGLVLPALLPHIEKAIHQANTHLEYFVPKVVVLNSSPLRSLQIGERIKDFYFGSGTVTKTNRQKLVQFYSSSFFSYDVITWGRIAAKAEAIKIYFYKFTCKSERNVFADTFGASELYECADVTCHCDDIAYLFTNTLSDKQVRANSKEYFMINNVTKLWTNFAKTGNPTPVECSILTWPQFDHKEQRYLNIGESLVVESHPEREEVEFWDAIFKEHYPQRSVQ